MRSRCSTTLEGNLIRANLTGWGRRRFRRCGWWRWRGRAWDGRNFMRGENLAAMQFLNSAWLLSQSGTVANRLGQVLRKARSADKARHMYALAAAAGGADVADSRDRLGKLCSADTPVSASAGKNVRPTQADEAEKEIADAAKELVQSRTVKLELKGAARPQRRNSISFLTALRGRSAPNLLMATKACATRASRCATKTSRCVFRMLRQSRSYGGEW